jgi:ornithine cyclodeaminase
MSGNVLILGEPEVSAILADRELELMDTVAQAYLAHRNGATSLTHSSFLRFPDAANRIIALPAYVGGDFEVAGIKWIASFPGNYQRGLARASAVIILNSTETGRPVAILEGSVISAKRTAASAVLAARSMHGHQPHGPIGIIGCGAISFEIVRFLRAAYPAVTDFIICDIDPARAERFKHDCVNRFPGIDIEVTRDTHNVLRSESLISIATTALKPHLSDLSACQPGTTILHISLRDIAAQVILNVDNVTDDVDHVCRAETSLHLAEMMTGNRDFIRCTLADILAGAAESRCDANGISVFSPFGLGVLDLALAKLVFDVASATHAGTTIDSFLPASAPLQ